MNSKRKAVLITGSAKGLGKMAALALARSGHHIVLNYVRSEQEALALQRQISGMGVRCLAVKADIADGEQRRELIAAAEREFGGVDILINNAGPFIRERKLFAEYTGEEIDRLLHANLLGVLHLDHLVLPHMRKNGFGRIIHFGFGHAGEAPGWPHRAVYAAAKVALVSFTKSLAVEEAIHGITVNMICPGDIVGDNKEKTIAEVAHLIDAESPRGRPGSGEDVSRVIEFLCRPESDFLTGNVIDVSGGLDPIRSLKGIFRSP